MFRASTVCGGTREPAHFLQYGGFRVNEAPLPHLGMVGEVKSIPDLKVEKMDILRTPEASA